MRYFYVFLFLNFFGLDLKAQKTIELYKAKEYVGAYQIKHNQIEGNGNIFWENNALVFKAEGLATVTLEQGNLEDEFYAKRVLKIVFVRDNFKKVIGAKLFYQSQEFEVAKK